ncbi:MAG: hypothetical protein ABL889_11360 [Terricaulis sp.]
MDVRVAGVVMLGRDPVDAGVEVRFHGPHQVAGVALKVVYGRAVLGRDDHPEMVPVAFAAFDEGRAVCPVVLVVKHLHRVALAAGAVALDIKRVPHERSRAACRLRVDLRMYLHNHALAAGGPLVFQFDGACAAAPTVPGRARARCNALGAGGGRRAKYRPGVRGAFRATPADIAFEFVFVVHRARLLLAHSGPF